MPNRILGIVMAAGIAIVMGMASSVETRQQWISGDGYDWWPDCTDVPDPFEFLPIYLGTEEPGYIDLGRTVVINGQRYRALQNTRDKDMGPTRATAGTWYSGMGSEHWPPRSVDIRKQLERFRVMWFDIDGNRHNVDPSCVMVYDDEDDTIGFYNAWVRFTEAGLHTIKITGRQLRDDPFVFPFAQMGSADPYGFGGRRVFLAGEFVGDVLDGDIVHTYEMHVGKD